MLLWARFGGNITGPPGPPVASVLIRFHRIGCFRKPVFCGFSCVSQTLELDSGSSARKGVEVQVLSSALVNNGVSRHRGKPRFLLAHPRVMLRVPCYADGASIVVGLNATALLFPHVGVIWSLLASHIGQTVRVASGQLRRPN